MHVALAVVVLLLLVCIASSKIQCSSKEASEDGYFSCLAGCDENHHNKSNPYCLSYFPDNGNCYLKPFTRSDILTCNGRYGAEQPPQWYVVLGGSNTGFTMKVLLDLLLDLPPEAKYDPKLHWNASSK
jgi:hypothetical protein